MNLIDPPIPFPEGTKRVKLFRGPFHGRTATVESAAIAIKGHFYVHWKTEGEQHEFVHVLEILKALDRNQRRDEKRRVRKWMNRKTTLPDGTQVPRHMSELIGIPPWRVAAWKIAITASLL